MQSKATGRLLLLQVSQYFSRGEHLGNSQIAVYYMKHGNNFIKYTLIARVPNSPGTCGLPHWPSPKSGAAR